MPYHIETMIIHPQRVELPSGNLPLVSPIYQSVKYVPKSYQHLKEILADRRKGFLYSRVTNPSVRELEILLAQIQGREDALCLGSGIGAVASTMIALAKAGDHVLMFRESYKPTRFLQNAILANLGVRTTVVGVVQRQEIERIFTSDPPKILLIESPTNPTLRIPDLNWLTTLCRKSNTTSILDNTIAGFQHHGDLPLDIYVHSLTKQASGHSDAMGGVIIANSNLIEAIAPFAITLGATLDPHTAWLISRGMKTYTLRTKAASDNAKSVAQHLEKNSHIKNLRYPGLPSHPDYEVWKSQMDGDGGSIVTFDLGGGEQRLEKFIDSLKIFALTPSMGCVESLVAPCLCLFADDLSPEDAASAGITVSTVRLALGIENIQDLILDLDRALGHCGLNP